ncbi:104 kDa microneme/rhoptry antigen [Drosophila subpulchrella]|uniref:104 kDa microneme/rhoptry antigen n=1 Tax=Drosophila subpulchrella TaxID=1486046 RepID=UPI0018A1B622|nr:104 kDa microneme/rhoptry antigen [Drosophila subpulchrella]
MKVTSGKTVLNEELLSMSLDDYYLKNVRKTSFVPSRSGPNSSQPSLYQRTHFFGPAYRNTPSSLLNLRVDYLRRHLKDLTVVVDSKGLVGSAQKRLDVITKRLAQVAPMSPMPPMPPIPPMPPMSPRPSPGQDPQGTKGTEHLAQETPKSPMPPMPPIPPIPPMSPRPSPDQDPPGAKEAQVPQDTQIAQDCEDTLVLTIGDEVLYDEAYKTDTLWMPLDDSK